MSYTVNSNISEIDLLAIAKEHFGVETLRVRGSDSLDFYDVDIQAIVAALKEAYNLGEDVGMELGFQSGLDSAALASSKDPF